MLAIRLQRVGRKGHAQYRVVVQDGRFSPKSGRVVSYVGSYNPHAKTAVLEKEKIASYLKNGAHPSERTAQLFKAEGIKLPSWVDKSSKKKRSIRNPEKLRRNRPADATTAAEPAPEVTAEESAPAQTAAEEAAPSEETTTAAAEETASEPSPEKEDSPPAAAQ